MDLPESSNQKSLLTLQQAAQILSVSVEVLLQWNDFNILKPTITKSGQVGYTQEQIERFLVIQQLSQHSNKVGQENNITLQQRPIFMQSQDASRNNFSDDTKPNSNTFVNSLNDVHAKTHVNTHKLLPMGISLSFLAIIISIIFATFIQYGKIKSSTENNPHISQRETGYATGKVLSSKLDNSPPQSPSLLNQTQGNISSGNDYNNPNLVILQNRTDTSLKRDSEVTDFAISRLNQAQVLGSNSDNNESNTQNNTGLDTLGYSEMGNTSNNTDETNNLFDNTGNIKGETKNADLLAAGLGTNKIVQEDTSMKPVVTNANFLLTFVMLGSISVFFVLRRKFAYSLKMEASGISPATIPVSTTEQKVLEVDQKMDGTVVMYFQGKEYKICKPELDSDSDQFIGKLMQLSQDAKEINYDMSDDENLRLSAPLSKLVTRLGFVGLKRDLFFPRTSKNRVLFRRYITDQDLLSMNLNASKISTEFFGKN